MSYDISLNDPDTDDVIIFDAKHNIKGGTYVLGGTNLACLNITYNYAEHYYEHLHAGQGDKGLRGLYGMTGEKAIPILEEAIKKLGTTENKDYWKSTPGNAGSALLGLLTFAKLRPDGIFQGD